MRTRRFYKYLMAMIIALGTTANVFAQQRALKIYFNEYKEGEKAPRMLVTDDNNAYDLPAGVTVKSEGVAWAGKSRFFEWVQQSVTDRVMADYVSKDDKKNSHLKLTFTDFPYEVNVIQWNVMNDLLSGSLTNWFKNYGVTTKCIPVSGSGFSYTEEHWSMNIFTHQITFRQGDVPWKSGAVLNGLTSFEISEYYETEIGIGSWTWWDLGQSELNDKNRTFIKAGWNGSNTDSNIADSDDSNWAFKVKFTLPDIRVKSYLADIVKNSSNQWVVNELIKVDNNIVVGEKHVHAIRGYISAHQGAVDPTYDPADQSDFHFKYEVADADKDKINIAPYTGIINEAKKPGDATVRIYLMRGSREVCHYDQTIHIYAVDEKAPEIAIAFADGKKGYDITVGDDNAQIQGYISKPGKDENNQPVYTYSNCHYEYSVDNAEIATISSDGTITALKEGDVNVSAVLKDANGKIKSNTYTYTLHVFGKNEGLEWKRVNTYRNCDNFEDVWNDWTKWKVTANNNDSYNWQSNKLLNVNTSINPSGDGWKQIASFNVASNDYWRAICERIRFNVMVPKYSKATATYSLAGNVGIGNKKTHQTGIVIHGESDGSCIYGFEIKDLGVVSSNQSQTNLNGINWNTGNSSDNSTPTDYTTIARNYTEAYKSNVGAVGSLTRDIDNSTSSSNKTESRFLAVMAYLWDDEQYPGDASFGFKGIPEYTYYATVTYYKNDGTSTIVRSKTEYTTTSKTETVKLFQSPTNSEKANLTRDGYTFVGWSTDPNATTAEYEYQGDFCPYDDVNGGGKGPVALYAVWKANTYIVALRHNSENNSPVDAYVYATYGQDLPSVDVDGNTVTAPTNKYYDFKGYYGERLGGGNLYYDEDMNSNHVWDRTDMNYVIAKWAPHQTKVVFDPQGGNNYGASSVTATFGQQMPTEGVQAPQRQGYTFGGYYSKQNGAGTQYYTASMTSARTWNIDERTLNPQVTEVPLYAKWIPIQYAVTLDKQGGTGGSSSVTASYGQPLPSGLTAPTKPGYEFRGYYGIANSDWEESQGHDIYYGGKQYYDKDMNGVEPWDQTQAATIYAHWAPKTYIVTLDADGGVFPNPVVDDNTGNFNITKVSNSVVTLTIVFKAGGTADLVHSTAKKPGYELLGWYDSNGVKVISVDEKSRNCTITDNGGYWTENGKKYNHPGDLTLTARYRQKYQTPSENVIAFDNEKVEDGEDWLWAVVNDLVGSAQDVYQKTGQQTMVFDLSKSSNMWTGHEYNCQKVMEDLQKPEYSEFISPNLLVYFNTKSWNADKCYNAVTADNKCQDLRVTDRYSIKIPTAFSAANASYARDAKVSADDPAKEQAKNSNWGTLCLPYPIKNNTNGVKFYELKSMTNNYMEFSEMKQGVTIPANTPVLYNRTDDKVSSMISIEEQNVGVPMNADYTAVNKSYSNADASIQDWEFRGNLKTTEFYGKGYDPKKLPKGAQILDGDVYYFKQNKFTYLNPKMVKNGTTYNAAKMTLYPYRAYFYRNTAGSYYSSSKVSAYSILVIGEDGTTLDITNTILGDGDGDGKIYDLNGIRVMQPVKGRLYIVDGQKKVYR